jgi:methionine salvage enolase-phosphatase E1
MQNCNRFLDYVINKNPIFLSQELMLFNSIQSAIEGPIQDSQEHYICNLLIDAFRTKEEQIFEYICMKADTALFTKYINNDEINAAIARLKNKIIPNARIVDSQEKPIDIRNILMSIWLVCYQNTSKSTKIYADAIQFYNLLGIKGIELSVEQRNYNGAFKKTNN